MGTSVQPIVVLPNTGAGAPDIKTPTTIVGPTAIEQATAAARASIAAGQPVIPGTPAAPAAPIVPAAGTPAPGTVAPEAGRAPGTEQTPGTTQQTPPGTVPAVEGQPGAEPGAADSLVVELPFTFEGAEKPFSMTADTPETAAVLAQLSEEVASGREARALVDQASQALQRQEDMREYSVVDPVGFLTDFLGNDAATAKEMALFLLTQPTLFNELKPTLQKLVSDPNELRALAGDVQTQRAAREKNATTQLETQRAVSQNLADVQRTVIALLPADMNDAARQNAFRYLMRDLQDFSEGQNADRRTYDLLPVHHVPNILRDSLAALGIDAEAAVARAAVSLAKGGGSLPPNRPGLPGLGRRTPPAVTSVVTRPKPNGAAFVASATVKATAGSIPSAGAGTPGAAEPLTAPLKADGSKMSTAETIAWHRGRIKTGQKTY